MIESGMALDYQGREIVLPETLFRKLQMLEGRLQKNIKEFLGVTAKVRLMEPHSIQRSEGKAQRIVDNRLKD